MISSEAEDAFDTIVAAPAADMRKRPDNARLVRLAETARPQISLTVDGRDVGALQGDTLLVAILTNAGHLRCSEFSDGARAGFCLMGACQDCWVWTENGDRLRACSTAAEAGMRIVTGPPEALWPPLA